MSSKRMYPKKEYALSGPTKAFKRKFASTKKASASSKLVKINPTFRGFELTKQLVPSTFATKIGVCLGGLTPTATSALGVFQVSGNSCHLPFNSVLANANTRTISNYVTGSGAAFYSSANYATIQPQGFTNFLAAGGLYTNYRVLASKIILQVNPRGPDDAVFVCVNANASGTNYNSNIWTIGESPFSSKVQHCSLYKSKDTVTKTLTTGKVYGVTDSAIRQDQAYSGAFNTSPSNEWVWNVIIQTLNNTATTYSLSYMIKVEYDVEFWSQNTGGLTDV